MIIPRTIPYPTTRHARTRPEHLAFIESGRLVTYGQLERMIEGAAQRLQAYECRNGDRVILRMRPSVSAAVMIHAIPRLGAVVVPISPSLPDSEWQRTVSLINPAVVVIDREAPESISAPSGIPQFEIDMAALSEKAPPPASMRGTEGFGCIDANRLHSIVLTSGTGGVPKGVALSFANHLFSALASGLNLGIRDDDRWLLNLPSHHIGGLAILMRASLYGSTVVVHSRFDVTEMMRAIEQAHVTHLSLVQTTLRQLLNAYPAPRFPQHLRAVLAGGGPVDSTLLREASMRGLPLCPTYGMTETASQVATRPPKLSGQPIDDGAPPLPLCDVEIRDGDGRRSDPDCEGTIHVRAPMVAMGYWDGSQQIVPFTRDGWFETCDTGSLDRYGRLHVRGRRDRVIISGGEKLHAEEVESALRGIDGINDAAALGEDDAVWGQALVALIECDSGSAISDVLIRRALRETLAPYKIPKRIERVDRLPRTGLGKIDYFALRSMIGSR